MPNPRNHIAAVTAPPQRTPNTTTTTTTTQELLSPPGALTGASFDSNMVIILAALLCALICALGLNSILRCALRCTRHASSTRMIAATTTTTGLKKKELRQIRIAVVGAAGEEISGAECPICLTEFEEGEKVRVLPICNHGFHVRCIDAWLAGHSSCPNCRHSVLGGAPVQSGTDDGDCEPAGSPATGDVQSVVVLAVRVES